MSKQPVEDLSLMLCDKTSAPFEDVQVCLMLHRRLFNFKQTLSVLDRVCVKRKDFPDFESRNFRQALTGFLELN